MHEMQDEAESNASNSDDKHRFFYVIMPVESDDAAAEKQRLIKSVAQQFDITAFFPQYNKYEPFNMESTITTIRASQFVVADLSLERPSCYYELGITETLGKDVYVIALSGSHIHQTSIRDSVRYYDNNPSSLAHVTALVLELACRAS